MTCRGLSQPELISAFEWHGSEVLVDSECVGE